MYSGEPARRSNTRSTKASSSSSWPHTTPVCEQRVSSRYSAVPDTCTVQQKVSRYMCVYCLHRAEHVYVAYVCGTRSKRHNNMPTATYIGSKGTNGLYRCSSKSVTECCSGSSNVTWVHAASRPQTDACRLQCTGPEYSERSGRYYGARAYLNVGVVTGSEGDQGNISRRQILTNCTEIQEPQLPLEKASAVIKSHSFRRLQKTIGQQ